MSGLTTIAEAVADLVFEPRPILCLDTCDFLDVIRSLEEDGNSQAATVRRLVDQLISDAKQLQVIITSLVQHEWRQTIEGSIKRASSHLIETDQRIARVVDSCEHAKIAVGRPPADYARLPLVQGLVDLAESLMSGAMILAKDDLCIERALSRVMDRRRPSHKGQIKDSIHLEHYLELSRQLSQAHFSQPILFVSANKADFWDGPPQLHSDLKNEFDNVGLHFFGKLEAALGRLGL